MISTIDAYNAHYERLEQKVEQELAAMDSNPALLTEYTVTTLNRHRLLPDLAVDDLTFFRNYLFNKYANVQLDPLLTESFLEENLRLEGDTTFLTTKQPALFCSFHFGTSVPTAMLLHKLGYDPHVPNITGNELAVKSARHLGEMLIAESMDNVVVGQQANPVRKSQQILIEMFLLLQQQKSMLVYLDANVGLSEVNDRKATVQFLNHPYFSQKGVSVLSYLSKLPIIPVLCYRTGPLQLTMQFGEPIRPDGVTNRETYIVESLQRCYTFLEGHIHRFPTQWKSWYLIHKHIGPGRTAGQSPALEKDSYHFNAERYLICPASTKSLLMDRQQYGYVPISATLGRYLSAMRSRVFLPAQLEKQIPGALLHDLLAREVLLKTV